MSYVYLPGTLCDGRVFRHLPPGHVVDLRHSDSLAAMLAQVVAAPMARFHLVGFSMGGHVAQEFALEHPGRVETLTVIAASGEGYPEAEKELVQKSLPLIQRGRFHGITDQRLRQILHPKAYEHEDLRRLIQDMAGADAKEVYLRQMKATLERRNLIDELPNLEPKALYIAGREDAVVPLASIETTARAARAECRVVETCGHYVPLEHPELTQSLLRSFTTTSR